MEKPRLMIAEEYAMVGDGLVRLLSDDYQVVRVVTDGLALLKEAPTLRPQVVIMNIGLPRLNGLAAGKKLKKLLPLTKIIVLTRHEDVDFAKEALHHWASGYLLKKSSSSELVKAVDAVLHNRTYVTPLMKPRIEEEFARNPGADHQIPLTHRQIEVIQLLIDGYTMKEAGALLDIRPRTVAFHKYKIMDEHGLKTHSDFVMFAIKHHITKSAESAA